ncbi:MAG TPA: DoxX family protein [Terracidiphilus sp.]|nr:DoxX family protein [Terracidiphilus sp.]
MLKRFLLLKAFPTRTDAGLLALRLFTALPLFLKHGTEKLFSFQAMAAHFPDPLHIGAVPSLLYATLSDGICSLLIVVGLATRWSALIVLVNIGVAWAFVHHFAFYGRPGEHGELIVLYLAAMLAIFLAGPGKYSVDAALDK